MTTELRPTYVVFPWATTAAYPASADPWSGFSTINIPALDYWSPNTPLAADDLNYVIKTITDNLTAQRTQATTVANWLQATGAASWQIRTTVTGGANVTLIAPSLSRQSWLRVTSDTSPTSNLWESIDGGASWTSLFAGAGATTYNGLLATSMVEFLGKVYIVWQGDGTSVPSRMRAFTYSSATFSGDIDWGATAATLTGEYFLLGAKLCIVGYDTSAHTLYSASSVDGTTWAAASTLVAAGGAFDTPRVASSGALAVVLPRWTGSTPTNVYHTTTDAGAGLTARTGPWASTDRPQCVSWSVRDALFVVGVTNGSGTDFRWYTSPDGLTWTLRSTLTGSILDAEDVRGHEHAWVALVHDRVTTAYKIAVSVDVGVTWHYVPIQMYTTFGSTRIHVTATQWGVQCVGGTIFTIPRGYDSPSLT